LKKRRSQADRLLSTHGKQEIVGETLCRNPALFRSQGKSAWYKFQLFVKCLHGFSVIIAYSYLTPSDSTGRFGVQQLRALLFWNKLH
jgi:hypothetical protein